MGNKISYPGAYSGSMILYPKALKEKPPVVVGKEDKDEVSAAY